MSGQLGASARRTLLRVNQGRVRRAGLACAEFLMRLLAIYLRLGLRAGIYVRGGFASGEPVVGLSDIDLVAIVGGETATHAGPRLLTRWRRLVRLVPGLDRAVDLACYSEPELEQSRWTRFTYGLDGRQPRSLFFPSSPRSWKRPGHDLLPLLLADLWPVDSWRRLAGPDLRPAPRAQTHPHLLAWAHLEHWCRLGLRVARAPAAPWAVYACVKLVAEPAKILLWLEHQERYGARREVLQRGLHAFPEEEETMTFALALLNDLSPAGRVPIDVVWPCFIRLSARIAQRLCAELEPSGATAVRLEGVPANGSAESQGRACPLVDWTAIVWPPGCEEFFVVDPESATDLAPVVTAAEASTATRFVTVLHDGLILRPGRLGREWFRSIDFAATDPVSAALLDDQSMAAFPNTAGWSASDTAGRAVAEHAAWLQLPRDRRAQRATAAHLAGVFSAARAALFHLSIQDGAPFLTMTFAATVRTLADRMPARRGAIEEAYGCYRKVVGEGGEVAPGVVRAAAEALVELGCYPNPFPHLQSAQPSRVSVTGRSSAEAGGGAAGAGGVAGVASGGA